MKYGDLFELVRQTAVFCHRQGAGYAQQSVVLQRVGQQLARSGQRARVSDSQILTCWHDLFLSGDLSWGYDLDNPNAPFFHVPEPDDDRASRLRPVSLLRQPG